MSDKQSVQNQKAQKSNVLRSEKKTGNGTILQIAEQELEHVVGGDIGETEDRKSVV
jgi:hypothetical protein